MSDITGAGVRWEAAGAVATVTLDSTPANALGPAIVDGLLETLSEIEASGSRVAVLQSVVPGYFAAGADLKHIAAQDWEGMDAYLAHLGSAIERVASLPIPSIAAIDGYALGGGLELAMACTLRVVGDGARLGLPEVKLGLLPGAGGTQRLPRLVGPARALDLLLTGRTLGAAEALAIGLADRAGGPDAAAKAHELAADLAARSRPALSEIRRCVDAAASTSFSAGMEVERDAMRNLFGSPDAHEGIAAFLEKRPARFSG